MSAKPVTTAQLEQIRKMAREKSISRDQFQLGLDNGMIARALDTIVEATTGLVRLAVDWSRTTEEMVRAGQYDWTNSNISEEHFSRPRTSGVVEGEYKLFHFNHRISSDNAVREMREVGFEPAGSHETLAYGEKLPETQRNFPIIGLGNPVWRGWYGYRSVVVLDRYGAYRVAFLDGWDGDWCPDYRFLARRK